MISEKLKKSIQWSGCSAVSIYRLASSYKNYGKISRLYATFLYRLNIAINGSDIDNNAIIGDNFHIVHSLGIVIGSCIIGDNFIVYQNVTIGNRETKENNTAPIIGNNVTVYAGAVVIGPIKIGNNVKIGANSVIITDLPDNCTAVGVPARIIKN